jgi:acyl-CoA reductase-like NAD-dependent aldehyde dehydrogenase
MASDLNLGHGLSKGVTQGPLINSMAANRVADLVSDAVTKGATLSSGSGIPQDGQFLDPVLLENIPPSANILSAEIFGPVAAVATFSGIPNAIEMANATPAGLAAYVYTSDIAKAWFVGRRLECGLLGVNDHRVSMVEGPFGGVKESGVGREGGPSGIAEYLHETLVCVGGMNEFPRD